MYTLPLRFKRNLTVHNCVTFSLAVLELNNIQLKYNNKMLQNYN